MTYLGRSHLSQRPLTRRKTIATLPRNWSRKFQCLMGLHAWIADFVETYYEEEAFVKRRRDKSRTDRVEDGIGDERIKQVSDVYRAPRRREVMN